MVRYTFHLNLLLPFLALIIYLGLKVKIPSQISGPMLVIIPVWLRLLFFLIIENTFFTNSSFHVSLSVSCSQRVSN